MQSKGKDRCNAIYIVACEESADDGGGGGGHGGDYWWLMMMVSVLIFVQVFKLPLIKRDCEVHMLLLPVLTKLYFWHFAIIVCDKGFIQCKYCLNSLRGIVLWGISWTQAFSI